MLKAIFSRYFARLIYPTRRGDWYERKGYIGESHSERFNNFIANQRILGGIYYKEFKYLRLERVFFTSGIYRIDSVNIKPNKFVSYGKPGEGLYIICFQGRGEYYESRFRDMALMARNTGATIVGFNPKGFHSSSGKTRILSDIVDDGIALVERLLAEGVTHDKIVLYGNSLGGAVQEMICQYFRKFKSIDFRQINSNSFKSLSIIIANNLKAPWLELQMFRLMKYAGWETMPGENFFKTGVYRCYLNRKNDRTILLNASFGAQINIERDIEDSPFEYRKTLKWLNDNSELIYLNHDNKDPHNVSLYKMHLQIKNEHGKYLTPWYFINKYLEESNKFV